MAVPYRGITSNGTYFITSATYEKISVFQTDRMAQFFPGSAEELLRPGQIPAS